MAIVGEHPFYTGGWVDGAPGVGFIGFDFDGPDQRFLPLWWHNQQKLQQEEAQTSPHGAQGEG